MYIYIYIHTHTYIHYVISLSLYIYIYTCVYALICLFDNNDENTTTTTTTNNNNIVTVITIFIFIYNIPAIYNHTQVTITHMIYVMLCITGFPPLPPPIHSHLLASLHARPICDAS